MAGSGIAESHVEEAALAWLGELGYDTTNGLYIGPDGLRPERASYGEVLLIDRLRDGHRQSQPHPVAGDRKLRFLPRSGRAKRHR